MCFTIILNLENQFLMDFLDLLLVDHHKMQNAGFETNICSVRSPSDFSLVYNLWSPIFFMFCLRWQEHKLHNFCYAFGT